MPALPTTRSRHRAVGNYQPSATHRTWQTTTTARYNRHGRSPMSDHTAPEWRPDPLLTIDDLAAWLGKPKNTLYAWHSRGKGPRAIRVGNTLRYRRSEVERWLDDHTDSGR